MCVLETLLKCIWNCTALISSRVFLSPSPAHLETWTTATRSWCASCGGASSSAPPCAAESPLGAPARSASAGVRSNRYPHCCTASSRTCHHRLRKGKWTSKLLVKCNKAGFGLVVRFKTQFSCTSFSVSQSTKCFLFHNICSDKTNKQQLYPTGPVVQAGSK